MEEELPRERLDAVEVRQENSYPDNVLYPDENISGFDSENEDDAADLVQFHIQTMFFILMKTLMGLTAKMKMMQPI